MSIAYLDPGNIESDLQSGTVAKYKLLWYAKKWLHIACAYVVLMNDENTFIFKGSLCGQHWWVF